VFGKRSTSATDNGIKAPAAPAQRVASAPPLQPALEPATQPAPKAGNVVEGGRSPIPSVGLGAPLVAAPTAGRQASGMPQQQPPLAPTATDLAPYRRLLRHQRNDFRRLDRGHRPRSARQARRRFGARGDSRHHQRDHRDQEHRDVDLRAGRAARRYLQRRARLWTARAAVGTRRHRRHHGERLRHDLHRGERQDPADRHPLSRQPATLEHLSAHRQPDRPARGRILSDLRRAPARRLARQTSSSLRSPSTVRR